MAQDDPKESRASKLASTLALVERFEREQCIYISGRTRKLIHKLAADIAVRCLFFVFS